MTEMITIIAGPGRRVRDPDNRNRLLPPGGIEVSKGHARWYKLLSRGDVVIAPPGGAAVKPAQVAPATVAPAPASPPAPAPAALSAAAPAVTGIQPKTTE
jgi:hypothetical protein